MAFPLSSTRRRPGRRSRAGAAGLGLLGAVALAACGTTSPSSTPTTASPTGATVTSPSGSSTPTLIVYAAEGYDSAMTKAFQTATGIVTKLDDDSTGPLLAKVQAEVNNPQWGLLWVDGDTAFAALDKENYLVKGYLPYYASTGINTVGQSVVPPDHSYIPTGVTVMAGVVYDSSKTPNPPTALSQLTGPQWKNKVGMNNPAISGPTYPFVAGVMNQLGGIKQGEAYFSKLKSNGLKIYNTNTDTLHALQTGQISLALIQSSAGTSAAIKDPSLKVAYLPKVTLLPSVIGIDAKASNRL